MRLPLTAMLWTLVTILIAISIFVECWMVPSFGRQVVEVYPSAEFLFLPALLWSIVLIGCGQAIVLIAARLVALVARGESHSGGVRRGLGALIALTVGPCALVVGAWVALLVLEYSPPAVMYGLIFLALASAALAVSLIMVQSRTRPSGDVDDHRRLDLRPPATG